MNQFSERYLEKICSGADVRFRTAAHRRGPTCFADSNYHRDTWKVIIENG
jgi:hypothetical protein